MTSDDDFVVFVCCVDIPLPYKHNGNSDVLQFALSCMSISHYKSSKYEKNIKNLKLFKWKQKNWSTLAQRREKQHGVMEILFSECLNCLLSIFFFSLRVIDSVLESSWIWCVLATSLQSTRETVEVFHCSVKDIESNVSRSLNWNEIFCCLFW